LITLRVVEDRAAFAQEVAAAGMSRPRGRARRRAGARGGAERALEVTTLVGAIRGGDWGG
jgi:hypothetical protein